MATSQLKPKPYVEISSGSRNLLRFTTAGSVDDGKSTLIGRLLYDSQAVFDDQLAAVKKSRINRSTGPIDFSLLTDGLRAEREQGITIDVAYRYFSTPRRKFIIADTPGHEQYTRNMATGASTADAAIVLIDATKGLLPQSRRHAYIASLLGIKHVIAAINKMDLISYDRGTFEQIAEDFAKLASRLSLLSTYIVPISALEGDNVVRPSLRMAWFTGPTLLSYLEELPDAGTSTTSQARFPVQYVIRPDASFRGFAGQVASGVFRRGDAVTLLPSNVKTRIKAITTFDADLEEAAEGSAITLALEDEVDVSRGDLLVLEGQTPHVSRRFKAKLVWMHPDPLDLKAHYLLKHTTRIVRARVSKLHCKVDVNTLDDLPASNLSMNDIVSVEIETTAPLFFDPYQEVRTTGSFILIDQITNSTVAAGMIEGPAGTESQSLFPARRRSSIVSDRERAQRFQHASAIVAVHERRSTAEILERALFDEGWNAVLIDSSDLSEGELLAVANALQLAGAIAIFAPLTRKQHDSLSQFVTPRLFEVNESSLSDQEIADALLADLRAWKNEERTNGVAQ